MVENWNIRLGLVSAVASVALVGALLVNTNATAAARTVTVWADESRGPDLTKLIDGNTTIAPGYTIRVKFFSSLTALQEVFDKSSVSSGPDVLMGPASFASQGAKSGKIVALNLGVTKVGIPTSGWSAMTYQKRVYGVPVDVETTVMYFNKDLFGASAPTTMGAMIDYYNTNKITKGLKGGICSFEGSWGAQSVLTALGGGAWKVNGSNPDFTKVMFNSPAFVANVKKYLLDISGKSTGFFQYENCSDSFKAGKIPFAITGSWNYDAIKAAGINIGLTPVPGLTAGSNGAQWVIYSGAFVTTYASAHGVQNGALRLVLNFMAGTAGQLAMSNLSKRPPANISASSQITDVVTFSIAKAAQTGMAQISSILDNKAGGSNWYDVLDSAFKDIFVVGKDLKTTLDAASVILSKNFASGAANL